MKIIILENVAMGNKLADEIYNTIKSKIALKLGDSIANKKKNFIKILLNKNKIKSITVVIDPNFNFSIPQYNIKNGDVTIFTGSLFYDNAKEIYNQFKFKYDYRNKKQMEVITNFVMQNPTFKQTLRDIIFGKRKKISKNN